MLRWIFSFITSVLLRFPTVFHPCSVEGVQLVLIPVGYDDENLVVFDQEYSRTFCYPNLDNPENIPDELLPAIHRDHGLDPTHELTQLKNNARVMCREVSGYTHLKRVYSVAAPRNMPSSNKRVKWTAECVGYEPLLSHCFTFNVSDKDSKCDNLLGIECGYCSGRVRLRLGENRVLTNPEYPHYSDDVICEWVVQAPEYSAIEVSFNDFELPPRNEKGHCHRGLLEIKEIHKDPEGGTVTKAVTSLCGSSLPDPISIPTNGAIIRFSSGLFIPRPIGEDAGFNLTVTAVAAPEGQMSVLMGSEEKLLDSGEIMAITFGILLFFFLLFFICYIFRRYKKDSQNSFQRRIMQERLATQRAGRHDAALTAMLAASLHTMGPVPSHTSPFAKYLGGFGGGPGEDKKKLSQTVSVPPRNAYSNLGYPPPSAPPPLPPPLACAPPPPNSIGLRGRDNAINCSNKGDQETDEEPLYMEATPLEKSFSYIQLDDIKYDNNPALSHHGRHHYSPFNKYLNAPLANSPKTRVCAYPNDFPNNLKINDSGSPNFPISPRNVSCSAQNMSSNTLNLWPSTSSLTPSNKTVPLTPAREKALNLNFALSPWNNLNGRGSISSCSESTSPYPGQTPKALRRPSNLSQCSRLFESCHNSSVTLNDICTTPCHPRCSSQDWSLPCITSKTRPFLSSPWHEKVQHLDNQSFSSCESVFTSGENLTQECNKSRNGLCKHSFSLNDRSELSSSTSHQAGHLSKSCGDVSPTTPLTEQDAIFDNMIQSAPTLPGAQNGLGFVKPVLRRVSQMFLASPSVYAPGAERKKSDDDTGVFFETSNTLPPDGMGGLEKKLEGKLTDGKGSTGIRKLGTRTISEASLKKDKMPMPTSPRRPPASSVSSTSFMHYKYSLLEKESNADRHALIPRSNSPEASDSSNSPNDRQAH